LQLPSHFLHELGTAVKLGGSVLEQDNPPLTILRLGDDGLVEFVSGLIAVWPGGTSPAMARKITACCASSRTDFTLTA